MPEARSDSSGMNEVVMAGAPPGVERRAVPESVAWVLMKSRTRWRMGSSRPVGGAAGPPGATVGRWPGWAAFRESRAGPSTEGTADA